MNSRPLTRVLLLIMTFAVLIVGIFSCDELVSIFSTGAISKTNGVTGEISVGVVLSLTGPPAASYGLPMQRGFELALKEINDSQLGATRIKLITIDDEGSVDGAVQAYNELIGNYGVSVILGPGYSNQVQEAFLIAQQCATE